MKFVPTKTYTLLLACIALLCSACAASFGEEPDTTAREVVLHVASPYHALPQLTTRHTTLTLVLENLSATRYHMGETGEPQLEALRGRVWYNIPYKHVNCGLVDSYSTIRTSVLLSKPLAAGQYRLRLPIYILHDDAKPAFTLTSEFSVLPVEEAPPASWDISQLTPSPYGEEEQSVGIRMISENTLLDESNKKINIKLETARIYEYGSSYSLEGWLDSQWYRMPYKDMVFFNALAYTVDPFNQYSQFEFTIQPDFIVGVLPAGRYRVIKEFWPQGISPHKPGEIAMLEFTVAEGVTLWNNE